MGRQDDCGAVLFEVAAANSEETIRCGGELAPLLRPGDVVALEGDLGAGKTTFARGLIQHLCGPATVVPSPTFTLVEIYETRDLQLWHCDLYRLKSPEDAFELGLEDAFAEGVVLIEWPDRLAGALPANRLLVSFDFTADGEGRRRRFRGGAEWRDRLAEGDA